MKRLQIAVFILLGILLTRHYGESWDELQFYKYADHALQSYRAWMQHGEILTYGNTYDNYGPAFVIFTSISAHALNALAPNWLISDLRHLIYFLTFLAGVWAFHDLAKRWMSQTAALAAALLFLTQPLFWGHAFFSPKDVPFMSLFLLSLSFGFQMVDSAQPISFASLTPSAKRTLTLLTTVWLVSVFGLFASTDLFRALIENLVQSAQAGGTNIISFIASDISKVNPEIYIQRYFVFFLWIRSFIFLFITFFLLLALYRKSPAILHSLFSILFPAILLGITASIRILGPLAGIIVAYYALRTLGKKSLPMLAAYAILAILSMYATWPYLWPNPPAHLLESFKVMTQYPWKGQVLFNGQYYASNHLPFSYLPVLLLIQFTEPVWLLFVVGIFTLRKNNIALVSTLLWFILPLVGLIVTRSPLYDNTRQIFFILPPVFLAAGLGVDFILRYMSKLIRPERSRRAIMTAIIALILIPGLAAGVRLHPFEYVYYNSFIGNPSGKFELDYWATSYREAANWLNENAPANVNVLVIGPAQMVEIYARDDINVISETDSANKTFDYVVIVARYGWEHKFYPDARVVHEVQRGSMTFTVIKEIKR